MVCSILWGICNNEENSLILFLNATLSLFFVAFFLNSLLGQCTIVVRAWSGHRSMVVTVATTSCREGMKHTAVKGVFHPEIFLSITHPMKPGELSMFRA